MKLKEYKEKKMQDPKFASAYAEVQPKKKKFKNWWKNNWVGILYTMFYVVCGLLVIGTIATSITACVMYGDKPITEIPAWALLFMFGKGGK